MHGRQVIGATGLLLALVACGDDDQSRRDRIDDPLAHDSNLDPIGVPRECSVSSSCEDGDRCTENRCLAQVCVAIPLPSEQCCEAVTLFEEDFDGALAPGLELSALNEAAGWSVVDAEGTSSPPNALYFGDPVLRTYDKGVQVAGSVTLPPIALPRDREAVLSMRLYAAIEPTLEYDLFWVEADIIGDTTAGETVRLLSKRELPFVAFQDFALIDIPLAGLAGEDVVLRLRFDTLDGSTNGFEGLYVDDLRVQGLCPIPPPCVSDAECDTGDACLATACSEVGCVSTDICQGEEPSPCEGDDPPEGCCTTDAECDDGDPRTLDVCDGATCAHPPNPDACDGDASCDDGDDCTLDACDTETATCTHTGRVAPGCCVPSEVAIADFDDESLQGLYVTDNAESGLFWRPDRTRATSGEFALYCGDPRTQTYTSPVHVKSSATTRPLTLPSGGTTRLELDLYKATRTARNWDVFQVFALRDGALFPLWSSRELIDGTTLGTWQRLAIPLGAHAGAELQLRFVFDSVGAVDGPYEGVYLDTIELVTTCE